MKQIILSLTVILLLSCQQSKVISLPIPKTSQDIQYITSMAGQVILLDNNIKSFQSEIDIQLQSQMIMRQLTPNAKTASGNISQATINLINLDYPDKYSQFQEYVIKVAALCEEANQLLRNGLDYTLDISGALETWQECRDETEKLSEVIGK